MGHALHLCVLACLSLQITSAIPLAEEFNDLEYDQVPNLITAMSGYDVSKSTPYSKDGDKGMLSPIFNPIYTEDGKVILEDFIAKAGEEVLCEKSFSTKTITSYTAYRKEKGSSMEFSAGGSVSAGGWGVEAKVGYEYGETKEDREVLDMFETNQGEIVMTTLSCSIYVVEIARFIKPVFMENFINGMRLLANGAVSSNDATKRNNFMGFLAEFGTHYQKQTRLGAKMIYEKRFSTRSKSKSESSSRSECAKHSVSAEVKGSYGGFSAGVEGHTGSEKCNDQANSSDSTDDSSDTESKFISIGIFPTNLSNWENAIKENGQKPLPLFRKLDLITRLFTRRNLEGLTFFNEETGVEESLNGTLLSKFYKEQYEKEFLATYPNERIGCGISGSCKIGEICKNDKSSNAGFSCSKEGTWTTITVSGQSLDHLSCKENGFVDMYSRDDYSGRQRWILKNLFGNVYNILVLGGTNDGEKYLSCRQDGFVDLFSQDDQSGRQKWIIQEIAEDTYNIKVFNGTNAGEEFLSCTEEGLVDLYWQDDNSGRQKWSLNLPTNLQSHQRIF